MLTTECDLAVIGGGPAGSSAALYGARAGMKTVIFEPGLPGGQIAQTDIVDNYPGLPDISGFELGSALYQHALDAGVEQAQRFVDAIHLKSDGSFLLNVGSDEVNARTVVCALGAKARKAGFSGEDTYTGRGVSYCASCDGMFYRGKLVYVIGGGKAACDEALFLSRIASRVIMLVRRDQFRAPKGIVDKIHATENIDVRFNTLVDSLEGEALPTTIVLKDSVTQQLTEERYEQGSFGVFVFTGFDPVVCLVDEFVDIADDGGVIAGEDMSTKTPGLFCAGDMRSKPLRQVVTAVSDGAIAATSAYNYLAVI